MLSILWSIELLYCLSHPAECEGITVQSINRHSMTYQRKELGARFGPHFRKSHICVENLY